MLASVTGWGNYVKQKNPTRYKQAGSIKNLE